METSQIPERRFLQGMGLSPIPWRKVVGFSPTTWPKGSGSTGLLGGKGSGSTGPLEKTFVLFGFVR